MHMLKFIKPVLLSKFLFPFLTFVSLTLFGYGFYLAAIAPEDVEQADAVRIMYVHVPSAWMALSSYFVIAILSICYFVSQSNFFIKLAINLNQIGALFAAITLITGSIWGKPMWGTHWVWDARLTSMLILFLFYIVQMLIVGSDISRERKNNILAITSIIGAINIPIIKYSVNMWNSLHQPASILKNGAISMEIEMFYPIIVIFLACICYSILLVFSAMEYELIFYKKQRIYLNKVAKEI